VPKNQDRRITRRSKKDPDPKHYRGLIGTEGDKSIGKKDRRTVSLNDADAFSEVGKLTDKETKLGHLQAVLRAGPFKSKNLLAKEGNANRPGTGLRRRGA